jgi:hypothetical protein
VLWTISFVGNCANDFHLLALFLYCLDLIVGWVGHEVPKVIKSVTQNSFTESFATFQETFLFPVIHLESAQVRLLKVIIVFYIIIAITLFVRGYNLSRTSVCN